MPILTPILESDILTVISDPQESVALAMSRFLGVVFRRDIIHYALPHVPRLYSVTVGMESPARIPTKLSWVVKEIVHMVKRTTGMRDLYGAGTDYRWGFRCPHLWFGVIKILDFWTFWEGKSTKVRGSHTPPLVFSGRCV